MRRIVCEDIEANSGIAERSPDRRLWILCLVIGYSNASDVHPRVAGIQYARPRVGHGCEIITLRQLVERKMPCMRSR